MIEAVNLDPEYAPADRKGSYAYENLGEAELAKEDRHKYNQLTNDSD